MENKYVLCAPLCGINDTLCQINNCYKYCVKTGRTLLINTEVNYIESMKYNFSDYFQFNNSEINVIYDNNEIKKIFENNKFTVMNDLYDYLTDNYSMIEKPGRFSACPWEPRAIVICDEKTNLPLNFDYEKNYKEDVLLHFQGGGGYPHKFLLEHISLTDNVKKYINEKINMLPSNYTAIHVRSTDFRIRYDYKKLLEDNINSIKDKNLYLATDDREVYYYYQERLPNIFNLTNYPDEECKMGLHHSSLNIKTKIYDALSDLYILINSNKIISNSHDSGYSKLAININKSPEFKKKAYNVFMKI